MTSEIDVVPLWGQGDEILWSKGEALIVCGPTGIGKGTLTQQLMLHRLGLRLGPLLGLPVAVDPEPCSCTWQWTARRRPRGRCAAW